MSLIHFFVSNIRVHVRIAGVSILMTSLLLASFILPEGVGAEAVTSIKSDLRFGAERASAATADDIGSIATIAKSGLIAGACRKYFIFGFYCDHCR